MKWFRNLFNNKVDKDYKIRYIEDGSLNNEKDVIVRGFTKHDANNNFWIIFRNDGYRIDILETIKL